MVNSSLDNIFWVTSKITRADRERIKKQRGFTLWITGLSASGKSSIAVATERALYERGCHTYILDGDNVRHGLNKNLGFSPEDRTENIRRIGEVAHLFRECGIINIVSLISPFRKDRDAARNLSNGDGTFIEIFTDCPISTCESRDPKGIYNKARSGVIQDFTGISAPYEPPINPEIHLSTDTSTIEECVQIIISYLLKKGLIT